MKQTKGPAESSEEVLRDALYLDHASVSVKEADGATRPRYSVLRGDVLTEMDLAYSDTQTERVRLSTTIVPAIQRYAAALGQNNLTNEVIQREVDNALDRLGLVPKRSGPDDLKEIAKDILDRVSSWQPNPRNPHARLKLLLVVTPKNERVPNKDSPMFYYK